MGQARLCVWAEDGMRGGQCALRSFQGPLVSASQPPSPSTLTPNACRAEGTRRHGAHAAPPAVCIQTQPEFPRAHGRLPPTEANHLGSTPCSPSSCEEAGHWGAEGGATRLLRGKIVQRGRGFFRGRGAGEERSGQGVEHSPPSEEVQAFQAEDRPGLRPGVRPAAASMPGSPFPCRALPCLSCPESFRTVCKLVRFRQSNCAFYLLAVSGSPPVDTDTPRGGTADPSMVIGSFRFHHACPEHTASQTNRFSRFFI